jgi:AcrR family transcriptional regulator
MADSKRNLKKEGTRKKIISAAFKTYSESSFAAPTIMIAKEAGIAHGSMFLHFPTRDDLLSCLAEEFGSILSARFCELSGTYDTIEELLGAHIDILSEYESFYSRLITESAYLPGRARAAVAKLQSGLEYHFNIVLNTGIESGSLKKLPPRILFGAWLGLVHYYLQNNDLQSSGDSILKRYKRQLIFTYCELLRRQ